MLILVFELFWLFSVNRISFSRFLTLLLQSLTPVSTHLSFILWVGFAVHLPTGLCDPTLSFLHKTRDKEKKKEKSNSKFERLKSITNTEVCYFRPSPGSVLSKRPGRSPWLYEHQQTLSASLTPVAFYDQLTTADSSEQLITH